MAKYKITAETATSFPTLVLPTPNSENWDALQSVTEIDLNGCSVTFQGMFFDSEIFKPNTSLESVKGGKILNTYSIDMQTGKVGVAFSNCSSLMSFTSDLNNLTVGSVMFSNCTSLTSFSSDLSGLTHGESMFYNCSSLTSFTSDLSSLENGEEMFQGCTSLTSFISDLSNLNNGRDMFDECTYLTSVRIKCTEANKSKMTKANLSIRSEAVLEVSTDGGQTWETITT